MHFSYYKRYLFIALVLYVLYICFLYNPSKIPSNNIYHKTPLNNAVIEGSVYSIPKEKPSGLNFTVKVSKLNGEKVSGNILAKVKDQSILKETVYWHDKIIIKGNLKEPFSSSAPGNFNWKNYLANKNIYGEIKPTKIITTKTSPLPFKSMQKFRTSILNSFGEAFEDDSYYAIISGITLGEKKDIDDDLYIAFQDSGAMHLLVASGSNVGFITWLVYMFCFIIGLTRRKAAFVALALAGVYAILAGADAPILRAYFITIAAVAGFLLNRNSGIFQGLIISCFTLLILNPKNLFDIGFQMSFLATMIIVIAVNNFKIPTKLPKIVKFVLITTMISLSAQLVLMPIFANNFYKISFMAVLSNIILIPLASLIMFLSFAVYLFYLLPFDFLFNLMAKFTEFFVFSFKFLVQFFAGFRISHIEMSALGTGTIIAYYSVLFFVYNLPDKKFRKMLIKPTLAIIFIALGLQFYYNQKTYAYLYSYGWNNGVIIKHKQKVYLFDLPAKAEAMKKTVLSLGSKHAEAIFLTNNKRANLKHLNELSQELKINNAYVPAFADKTDTKSTKIKVGEKFKLAKLDIEVLGSRRINVKQEIYHPTSLNEISYDIKFGKTDFLISSNCYFTTLDKKIYYPKNDEIKKIKL